MTDKNKPREFPRIAKTVLIEASVLSFPLPEIGQKGVISNISGGGICFTSPVSYAPQTPLNLKINLVGWQEYKKPFSRLVDLSSGEPLTVIGEVVWCTEISDKPEYEVGIKFLNIYEDDHRALITYLKKNS
jgi:hypothetical protein